MHKTPQERKANAALEQTFAYFSIAQRAKAETKPTVLSALDQMFAYYA